MVSGLEDVRKPLSAITQSIEQTMFLALSSISRIEMKIVIQLWEAKLIFNFYGIFIFVIK